MDYKRTLAHYTANYRSVDRKALAMKKSWSDVEKLLSNVGPGRHKKTEDKNKKSTK